MKTYKITVAHKRADGTVKEKALYRVEAETEEQARKKLEASLVNDQPHEIIEVTE